VFGVKMQLQVMPAAPLQTHQDASGEAINTWVDDRPLNGENAKNDEGSSPLLARFAWSMGNCGFSACAPSEVHA
jgi:hypothetical protein